MLKFDIGSLYKTAGIDHAINKDKNYYKELVSCFEKYLTGNWGDLCEEDKKANERAILNNERLLGAYLTSKGKIFIITEANRASTTILFANEY